MTFDNFKRLEKTYKALSKGVYNRKEVLNVYKTLPDNFKVTQASKTDRVAGIKVYYESVFIPALEKILGYGISGQTTT